MKHIVSFSGGKDSTAMLLMMIEKGMQIDKIVCVDTTKEFPYMYEHIKKVQEYIKPLEMDIVKIDFDYWFGEHIKTKGNRTGEVGYGWADFRNRWCTSLKREAINKFVNRGDVEYLGYSADEKKRIKQFKGRNIIYPLIEWGVTGQKALEYCYLKGFNWEGLYEKFSRVSCWCCTLQRIGEFRILYNDFPELWKELKEMDKKSFRGFRPDYTVEQLEQKFKKEGECEALYKEL